MAADTKRGAGERYLCPRCGFIPPEEDIDGLPIAPVDSFEECRLCGGNAVSWDDLCAYLAAQGLHVVTAADKAVLEACAAARISRNDMSQFTWITEEDAICRAELARREQKA